MDKVYFRYKEHPGDVVRSADTIALPNPDEKLEDFLVWFLYNYQSDSRVAYVDDLFKLLYNEFSDNNEKEKFISIVGEKTEDCIREEIKFIENKLKNEAFNNFYNLVLNNKIELIFDGEK